MMQQCTTDDTKDNTDILPQFPTIAYGSLQVAFQTILLFPIMMPHSCDVLDRCPWRHRLCNVASFSAFGSSMWLQGLLSTPIPGARPPPRAGPMTASPAHLRCGVVHWG